MSDLLEQEKTQEGNPQQTEEMEVEPVQLSKKTTGLILVLIILVIIIICCIIKDGSNRKNIPKATQTNKVEKVQSENSNSSSSNMGGSDLENVGNSSENLSVSPTLTVEANSVENSVSSQIANAEISDKTVTVPEGGSAEFVKTSEPILGDSFQTKGIIKNRTVYSLGNSYVYGIEILIILDNGMDTTCSYFCPKNTYSALTVGDTVYVTYQCDNLGNISINTISK